MARCRVAVAVTTNSREARSSPAATGFSRTAEAGHAAATDSDLLHREVIFAGAPAGASFIIAAQAPRTPRSAM
jgi:hypothetical protein